MTRPSRDDGAFVGCVCGDGVFVGMVQGQRTDLSLYLPARHPQSVCEAEKSQQVEI